MDTSVDDGQDPNAPVPPGLIEPMVNKVAPFRLVSRLLMLFVCRTVCNRMQTNLGSTRRRCIA
eukprot:1829362-Amphidinium_carterae.1